MRFSIRGLLAFLGEVKIVRARRRLVREPIPSSLLMIEQTVAVVETSACRAGV
ncbi:MAG TPA: hypothetical protein VMT97_02070 [Terriglobales bacterium]|nr:hypothetical protein [Terriglobales bacterium]